MLILSKGKNWFLSWYAHSFNQLKIQTRENLKKKRKGSRFPQTIAHSSPWSFFANLASICTQEWFYWTQPTPLRFFNLIQEKECVRERKHFSIVVWLRTSCIMLETLWIFWSFFCSIFTELILISENSFWINMRRKAEYPFSICLSFDGMWKSFKTHVFHC